MRREIILPDDDREFLEAHGHNWETFRQNGNQWLLIREFGIPAGYNHKHAEMAVQISPLYPETQIDMVYFYPGLARIDGKMIKALSTEMIDNRNFQRWSRHRTAQNPWRPGLDDISTHITLVQYWLEREIGVQ